MCGLAGAVWTDPQWPMSADILQRMTDALTHRGPDAEGHWYSPPVAESPSPQSPVRDADVGAALGHRRLSIIDVEGSPQPLWNEDHSVVVVFNGEIYNFRELRQQLQTSGHQFRTDGDTEVLVHLYEEHGSNLVQHLRGMFAFAIWDLHRQTLLLARDRLGQKPLYISRSDHRIVFASELKSVLQAPDTRGSLSPEAILEYMTLQYVPSPRGIMSTVSSLPPATVATWHRGTWSERVYWSPPYHLEAADRPSPGDWCDELRQSLNEAVRLRMISEVPLGGFLSGGIDSTLICGLMQPHVSDSLKTFSIGFEEAEYDESEFARLAANRLRTEHHEQIVTADAEAEIPRLIWHYDEPFSDSSAIPTMALSRFAREHVTVALTGDAGDELFTGYERYRAVRLATLTESLPAPVRRMIASLSRLVPTSLPYRSTLRRLRRFAESQTMPLRERYFSWMSIFPMTQLHEVAGPALRDTLHHFDPRQKLSAAWENYPQRDAVTRAAATDLVTYLPGDLLTKVDRAGMAVGLECRSPFLDHHVVELAAKMPLEVRQTRTTSKRVLKESFADLLPETIQKRPKMGFGVPIDHWFRGPLEPLLRDTLLSTRCLQRGFFREQIVRQMIDDHTSGRIDHAYRLWNLLCLELWLRMYYDQPAPLAAPASIC